MLHPSKIQPRISGGVSTTEYEGNNGDVARTLSRLEFSNYGKVDRQVENKQLRLGTKLEVDRVCRVRHAEGVEQNQSQVSY